MRQSHTQHQSVEMPPTYFFYTSNSKRECCIATYTSSRNFKPLHSFRSACSSNMHVIGRQDHITEKLTSGIKFQENTSLYDSWIRMELRTSLPLSPSTFYKIVIQHEHFADQSWSKCRKISSSRHPWQLTELGEKETRLEIWTWTVKKFEAIVVAPTYVHLSERMSNFMRNDFFPHSRFSFFTLLC